MIDIRDGGPVRHATEGSTRARALGDECLKWLPGAARTVLPALDVASRRWLRRSRSPYVREVEGIAEALAFPGLWFLNSSYQWGCTAIGARRGRRAVAGAHPDWPFQD